MDTVFYFVNEICEILGIEPPAVSFDCSGFETDTMMARCDASGKKIYVRKPKQENPDTYFAIAHELRHIWQLRNGASMENYKSVSEIGLDAYNAQPEEIDANAFSGMVMVDMFGLRPLWRGLSAENIKRIEDRQEELKRIYAGG